MAGNGTQTDRKTSYMPEPIGYLTCRRLVDVAHSVLEYVRHRKSEEWIRQAQDRWRDTDALSASRMSTSDNYKDSDTQTFGVTRFYLNISRPPSRPCVLLLPLLHPLSILRPRCFPQSVFNFRHAYARVSLACLFTLCGTWSSLVTFFQQPGHRAAAQFD